MIIYERLYGLPKLDKGIALSIGNFEGYHLGHQSIVRNLKLEAKKRGLLTCIITFKNHPLHVLKGYDPERLWSKCDKIINFNNEGIDFLVYLNFTTDFATMEPGYFLETISKEINPSLICLGESFRFGKENKGDVYIIEKKGYLYGWELLTIKDLEMFGEKISSTNIRSKIKNGDIKTVNAMLGRNYTIYLKPNTVENSGKFKLFIGNMATPEKGTYEGEVIELKSKSRYGASISFKNKEININRDFICNKDSLYAFAFYDN